LLEDGVVLDSELVGVNTSAWVDQGISIELAPSMAHEILDAKPPSGTDFHRIRFQNDQVEFQSMKSI
jgi:hypothetical protein